MTRRMTEAEQVFDEVDGAARRNRLATLQDIREFANAVGGKSETGFDRGINFAVSRILEHLDWRIKNETPQPKRRKGRR